MIDIQNHIRNRDALNLFDGRGYKPAKRSGTRFVTIASAPRQCGKSWFVEGINHLGSAVVEVYEGTAGYKCAEWRVNARED